MLRAGNIVGGHVVAGEGVDVAAKGGEFRRNVPVWQLKHFVLQEVGDAGGNMIFLALQPEIRMDRTEIGDKIGQLFAEARTGDNCHRQTIGKDRLVTLFSEGAVITDHAVTPLRIKEEWSCRERAASATCRAVACSTAAR